VSVPGYERGEQYPRSRACQRCIKADYCVLGEVPVFFMCNGCRQSRWCHEAGSCQALARARLELLRDTCPVYDDDVIARPCSPS
jgi:hypothetical protein